MASHIISGKPPASAMSASELSNLSALNLQYLELLRQVLPASTDEPFAAQLHRLARRHQAWLAEVPVMLMSLSESNADAWASVFDGRDHADLFDPCVSGEARQLLAVAAGFVWHLVDRNPYVVRVVCGASPEWCERVSSCSYVEFVSRVVEHPGLMTMRLAGNKAFWERLLTDGVSADRGVRRAAHIAALQAVLICEKQETPVRLSRAARSSRQRGLRVAERRVDR